MQAPIEVSTIDQVKTILMFGEYHISCKYQQIFQSNREIVNLKIINCPNSKQRQTLYTLSDLKDLESKIILIRDSSPTAVNGQQTQLSEDKQKARHGSSISSDASLFESLSSKEVNGFLDVSIL